MTAIEIVEMESKDEQPVIKIRYRHGLTDWVAARKVINAAGVSAVDVGTMIDSDFPLKAALIRGDSMKFHRNALPELYHRGVNIYPTPKTVHTPFGPQRRVGVHITPMFDHINGQFVVGDTFMVAPKLTSVNRADDFHTPMPGPEAFVEHTTFFP